MPLRILMVLTAFMSSICFAQTPANDLCENAESLSVPSSTFGNTEQATDDSMTFCGHDNTAPGVWYSVIGTGNTMIASTCSEFSAYDTKIDVWCSGCEVLTCVVGNDDDCSAYLNTLSTAYWCSEAGSEYLIHVSGFGGEVGLFQLLVYDDGTPCADPIPCGGPQDIPTLNEWGMLIMGLLLLAVGTIAVVRRRKAALRNSL